MNLNLRAGICSNGNGDNISPITSTSTVYKNDKKLDDILKNTPIIELLNEEIININDMFLKGYLLKNDNGNYISPISSTDTVYIGELKLTDVINRLIDKENPMYSTFNFDFNTGDLFMYTPEDYHSDIIFTINDNGEMEVDING